MLPFGGGAPQTPPPNIATSGNSSSGRPAATAGGGGSSNPSWTQLRRGFRWAVGGYLLYNIGSAAVDSWRRTQEYLTLPPAFWLDVDLERQVLVERPAPLALLRGGRPPLEQKGLLQALSDAAGDPRCCGLLAVLGGRENFGGLASLQELRSALLDFKAKAGARAPLTAYCNSFGEGGVNATAVYYLASAFDGVYCPPTAMVSLTGFEASQVFVKQLLDRAQISAEVFRREEYKSALSPLTNEAYDDAQRDNMTALLEGLSCQVIKGIASGRKLPTAAVAAAMDEAPLTAPRAAQLGLLDGLLYRDQVEELLTARARDMNPADRRRSMFTFGTSSSSSSSKPPPDYRVDLTRYTLARLYETSSGWMGMGADSSNSSSTPPRPQPHPATAGLPFDPVNPPGDLIATARAAAKAQVPMVVVVHASGAIMQGGGGNPSQDQQQVDSHKFVRALRWLRRCPQVKAVVLRINSPGGSAVASDMIAREVALLGAAGKPVIASMGDVAASGGYYIAAPCRHILAQPATLTGSIGVIMARFNFKSFLNSWGVTHDSVRVGENADWTSVFTELRPEQRAKIEAMTEGVYQDFLGVVARGRHMALEAVRQLAKGRVYTGQQALEVGLVDELGGLPRALQLARQAAHLPEDPAASITAEWPSSRITPLLAALSRLSNQGDLDNEPGSTTEAAVGGTAESAAGGAPSAAATAAVVAGQQALAGVSSWSNMVNVWLTAALVSAASSAAAAVPLGGVADGGTAMQGLPVLAAGVLASIAGSSSSWSNVGSLSSSENSSAVAGVTSNQQQQVLAAAAAAAQLQVAAPAVAGGVGAWWQLVSQPGPQCASLEAALLAASC